MISIPLLWGLVLSPYIFCSFNSEVLLYRTQGEWVADAMIEAVVIAYNSSTSIGPTP